MDDTTEPHVPMEIRVRPLQPGQRTTELQGCNQYPPPRGLEPVTEVTCISCGNGYWKVADDTGREWQVFMLTLQSEVWGRTPGGKWHRVR
jgi:hypothetical protein